MHAAKHSPWARLITAVALCGGGLAGVAAQEPLRLVRTFDLPHVEGRIDHLAVDATSQQLFVAALGNNTVEVLDLKAGRDLKSLPGFHEPQGIGVAVDAKRVAIANGEGDGVQLIEAADFRTFKSVALGDDSDNVRYDAEAMRLYVGYGGGAIAAVNPRDGGIIGRVTLPGHPESFQLERSGSRIFVNVPSANQIAVVDRGTMKVVASWPLVGTRANYPMALDEANHRLLIGCRRPARALIVDTTTGKQLGSFDIVGDTDDLFYDGARKRVYVTGGDGYIDVFQEHAVNEFTRAARVASAPGARTSLYIPDLNRLYVAVPHRGVQKAEVREYAVR